MSENLTQSPDSIRTLFDSAYAEIYGLDLERVEVEVLSPLPDDTIRLFFELADEALLNPARDNPFAEEKRVFELSSETLAQELVRLQALGESALLSFSRGGANAGAGGQLPNMLATMFVGAARVNPVSFWVRIKAAVIDNVIILLFTCVIAAFIAWFSSIPLRAALLALDPPALVALAGLVAAIFLPLGIAYHLRAGRSLGYRKQSLEIVNTKSGNPITRKTSRARAWLFPLGVLSLLVAASGRWIMDRVTQSTVRRNYALRGRP